MTYSNAITTITSTTNTTTIIMVVMTVIVVVVVINSASELYDGHINSSVVGDTALVVTLR